MRRRAEAAGVVAAAGGNPRPASPRYRVLDRRLRWSGKDTTLFTSDSRREVYNWILGGLRGTQGAERDHYVSCLLQLEQGKYQLYYDLDA